tara:strand:+ start:175 stop:477 length:303 start_codon:yes stop_codon:yes gene_type:complete
MSDLDGTLSAITLEHLNHADGPQRITVTAEGSTTFVRDTITEHHPIYGVHESRRWLPTTRRPATLTPRQIIAVAYSHELQGWQVIAMAHHGMPSVGRIQR